MVEHDMSLVLNICDWIQVLDFGRPLMAGTPDEVRSSPRSVPPTWARRRRLTQL